MKLAALLAALPLAVSASGQGLVDFRNTSATRFYTNSYVGSPGLMSGNNAYYIGLYAGPLGSPASSLELVGLATNSVFPGLFNGGSAFPLPSPDFPAGTAITFQIRAWQFSAGSWDVVAAQIDPYGNSSYEYGISPIGSVTPGNGSDIPIPALFGPGDFPGQLTAGLFIAAPVPEPGAWALGVLAIAFGLQLLTTSRGRLGAERKP